MSARAVCLFRAACQRGQAFMLVFQLISWDVIRQGIYPSCTPSHWLSQDCKILGCSPSTCFCFLYFCHNTPLLCWRPKTVILQLNIINTMEVFSAQTHQGFFLFFVYLVGCFTAIVFLYLLLARHLTGKNQFLQFKYPAEYTIWKIFLTSFCSETTGGHFRGTLYL